MKIKVFAFAILTMFSSMSHAVIVNFSGDIPFFNPGPFTYGQSFTGSFTLDESIIATPTTNRFVGAVDNFTLNVAGNIFTGENGDANQLVGGDDILLITIGGVSNIGSVSGQIGGNLFTGFSFDLRGVDLFSAPSILANNLVTSDFNYVSYVFGFGSSSNSTIGRGNTITSLNFTPSSVPVPSTVWLFGTAILGLIGFGRRKKLL